MTFATEVQSIGKHTLKSSNSIDYLRNCSPQYQTISNPEHPEPQNKHYVPLEIQRMSRQLGLLKKRNRELSSVNSKIIEKASSIEEFFMQTVNELKRKIRGRKHFSDCSFEDFRQEDKL